MLVTPSSLRLLVRAGSCGTRTAVTEDLRQGKTFQHRWLEVTKIQQGIIFLKSTFDRLFKTCWCN